MLDQALTALAAAGGTAVVEAAGSDGWTGLRRAMARWFGRGDGQRELQELERLDRTVAELETAETAEAERERTRDHQTAWRTRFEMLLESLDEATRAQAAEELRNLLKRYAPRADVSADQSKPIP